MAGLAEILRSKEEDLRALRDGGGYEALIEKKACQARAARPVRDFVAALQGQGPRIIAEVKKASPSKGVIREDFDPVALALEYEAHGAAALSVLTEEKFFLGSLEYLSRVSRGTGLPVLRKDFILDEIQVYEARAAGADAVLLITDILTEERLEGLMDLTGKLGMTALVEVHDREGLEKAKSAGARLIGINNRDLRTFRTDMRTTEKLAPLVPAGAKIVSESGINRPEDIRRLMKSGVTAFLIGEALAREKNAGEKLRELLAVS